MNKRGWHLTAENEIGRLDCFFDPSKAIALMLEQYPDPDYSQDDLEDLARSQGMSIEEVRLRYKTAKIANREIFLESVINELWGTLQANLQETLDFLIGEADALVVYRTQPVLNYKQAANELLQKRLLVIQERLHAGRGKPSSPHEFLIRVGSARDALRKNEPGRQHNQEAVAGEMGISSVSLRKQCRTFGYTWEEVLQRTIPVNWLFDLKAKTPEGRVSRNQKSRK